MRVIAIEEHFLTPMYRQHVSANEYRNFYLTSRGQAMGHDIIEENLDIDARRIANMDANGVDLQVLSFGSPGPQAFAADVAIPMAKDANERMYQAVKGNGGTARFVFLPYEDHGYRARESVLHTVAEMLDWFDRHVKNRKAVAVPAEAASGG